MSENTSTNQEGRKEKINEKDILTTPKNNENTVKDIAKAILRIGIITTIVLILAGLFVNQSYGWEIDDINWILVLSGIFSLLLGTLPLWGILTMLSNISTSLKKLNGENVEEAKKEKTVWFSGD